MFILGLLSSVAANSYDQIYCMQLAQNAVHGAMAGYTAFSVGMVNDRTVSSEQHAERYFAIASGAFPGDSCTPSFVC